MAIPTTGNDTLLGTAGNDTIDGLAGSDSIYGGVGNDLLLGNDGDDYLSGDAGSDTIDGGAGYDRADYRTAAGAISIDLSVGKALNDGYGSSDTLIGIERIIGSAFADSIVGSAADDDFTGSAGNDTMDGGAGFDFVWYGSASAGVQVDLAIGSATGGEGNDTLISIEAVTGSQFGDSLRGTADNNNFRGGGGNDSIEGNAGVDRADYRDDPGGVTVNLETGTAQDGFGGTDTLTGIEEVRGSRFNDTLTSANNIVDGYLDGYLGDDTLIGGSSEDILAGGAGDDSIVGGANNIPDGIGLDLASYTGSSGPVNVNLTTGLATGAQGNDTLTGIEGVLGSAFDDVIVGDSVLNFLRGNAGNDTLDGAGGHDYVDYRAASGGVTVSLATNTSSGADGNDTLLNFESIRGSQYADMLTGDSGDNTLRGERGDDTLDGGDGTDRADYRSATGAVTVSLVSNTSSGADGNDTLINIENIRGSVGYGDTLIGNGAANVLDGRGGDDTLTGGGGADTFLYGDTVAAGGYGSDGTTFHSSSDGIDTITDFEVGDKIVVGATLAALAVTAGDGSTVTGDRVQAQTVSGVTTLYIDTNNVPGADVQIKLTGSFATSAFTVTNNGDGTSAITSAGAVTPPTTAPSFTVPGTPGNDVFVLTAGNSYLGGGGSDTYLISRNTLAGNVTARITDTEGADVIQLADGTTIASSSFYADAVQLTLSTGASVQVLGASHFSFQVGANAPAGDTAALQSYSQFASALGAGLPAGSTPTSGTAGFVVATGFTQAPAPAPVTSSTSFTVPGTLGNDVFVLTAGNSYLGGGGSDTYLISRNTLAGNVTARIMDTEGADVIQLADGTTIASSSFYADAVQLTLSTGASVQVLGASHFSFQVGANAPAGDVAASQTYVQFGAALGVTIPSAGGSAVSGTPNFVVPTSANTGLNVVNLSSGTVVASSAAEEFRYDFQLVNGRATKAGDGEVTITGFSTASDKLVFVNTSNATVYTEAQFKALAGVSILSNPFDNSTSLYFDPNSGFPGGVTLTGIQDATLSQIVVETLGH